MSFQKELGKQLGRRLIRSDLAFDRISQRGRKQEVPPSRRGWQGKFQSREEVGEGHRPKRSDGHHETGMLGGMSPSPGSEKERLHLQLKNPVQRNPRTIRRQTPLKERSCPKTPK